MKVGPSGSAADLEFPGPRTACGGQYWFLLYPQVPGGFPDPTGVGAEDPRYELFAVSERGDTVQLTQDSTFRPNPSEANLHWTQRGGVVDGRITLVGRRWDANLLGGVEAGICAIDLDPETLPANINQNLDFPVTRLPIELEMTYDEYYGPVTPI